MTRPPPITLRTTALAGGGLRWNGITIPPTDCLIAVVAIRRKLLLYANDSDFDNIPGLRRYTP